MNQDDWRKMLDRDFHNNEHRIAWAAAQLGLEFILGKDPRGYTVKLLLPSGRYNTWGGKEDGWGVPTS